MAHEFKLPATLVGPTDLARLKRELAAFDEQQHQAELKAKSSGNKADAGRAGKLLSEIAENNGFDLNDSKKRQELLDELDTILKTAPTITMSFAVDPSSAFMSKVVEWLRTSIHPQVLVRIGLQPNIAAGCVLRTPSKIYDFSLRSKFTEQRPELIRRLQLTTRPTTSLKAPSQEAPA